jgi:prepilin-type N-terminal cleavage/methylation domain-containing protein
MQTENITENYLLKWKTRNNPRAMTLIELLVVLGILAALAGLTLSFVNEMSSSSRQTITREKLNQIETAIIGNTTHSSRFLNDMGRLPVNLNELWDSKQFDTETNNPDINYNGYGDDITNVNKLNCNPFPITLNGGWKGPYLNVPNGKLYDGFGNEFHVANPFATGTDKIVGWDKSLAELDVLEDQEMIDMINLNPEGTILKFGSFGEDDKPDSENDTQWQNQDDTREIRRSQVFSTLHVKILLRDKTTSPATWLPPIKVENACGAYNSGTSYKTGSVIYDDEYGLFVCTYSKSLTSDLVPTPAWDRNNIVTDEGSREWAWLPRTTGLNRLRVTVFSPYVFPEPDTNNDPKSATIRTSTAFYPNSGTQPWGLEDKSDDNINPPPAIGVDGSTINEVTFFNLTPGIRKILAYGYVEITEKAGEESETKYYNGYHSNVQIIELKAGENFVTIHLYESFFD